jgi:hypothetical protein
MAKVTAGGLLKGALQSGIDAATGAVAGPSSGNTAKPSDRSFTLSGFRSAISNFARNQYFEVDIPMVGLNSKTLTALARTTELPAITHQSIEVPYRGVQVKHLSTPTYADWTVTFLCDENHQLRHLFANWLALAYNTNNLQFKVGSAYKAEGVSVSQLNSLGTPVSTVWFYGMFPINVGPASFDQAGGNFITFDVTFMYDFYTIGKNHAEGGNEGIIENVAVDAGGLLA